jgi:hypothetical protein
MIKHVSVGTGNTNPATVYAMMKATAATIAKGDIVALSGSTGYTVIKCTADMMPCGVAAEAFAASAWGQIITAGFCDFLTCTSADIVDADQLYCDASSDAATITVGTDIGATGARVIGVALQAQTDTTITAAHISPSIQIVSSPEVGPSPGNLVPATVYREMLDSGSGIAKGDIVALSGTTGYTVIKGTNILTPIGVAAETIAAGKWGKIITAGFCDYLTCTAANITDTHVLYCDSGSDAAGIVASTATYGVQHMAVIGVALQDQSGTTLTASYISPAVRIVEPDVSSGPGNAAPATEIRTMKATAATIAKGDIVSLSGETGYTVVKCTNVMVPCGVAAENFAASAWGKVVTSGFCDFLTCETTNIADTNVLYCDSGSDAAGDPVGTDFGVEIGAFIGVTLQAQTGTTITKSYIGAVAHIV